MKTSNTILCSLAGVVLVAAILLMVRLWSQTLRDDQCSPLYQRYCHTPGIEASFVKGFRINDTLAIDATLLHATDSASWARLKTDFEIPELPPDFQQLVDNGNELILTKKIPKSPPPPPTAYPNDLLAVSSLNWKITVFHISNDAEKHAIVFHNLEDNERQI